MVLAIEYVSVLFCVDYFPDLVAENFVRYFKYFAGIEFSSAGNFIPQVYFRNILLQISTHSAHACRAGL